jgi:hypothetical protein
MRVSRSISGGVWRSGSAGFAAFVVGAGSVGASAQSFVDVTKSAGIVHTQTTAALASSLPGSAFFTGGVAAADFDGDGWTDLVFTRLNDVDILYRNRGDGTFEARTKAAGFGVPTLTNGVVSGDIDNDGDADLYMTTCSGTRNYLYLNNGRGVFTDAGTGRAAALANGTFRNGQGATFGDYDRDGYLDLMTCDWGRPTHNCQSRLFRNLGAAQPGHFEDVTVAAGLHTYRGTISFRFSPRFVDLDRDGHQDLAIASDFFSSQLFWNNGDGTFTDGTIPAGVGTDYNGMGSTFGDYDGDGDLDWFISNITADPDAPPTGFGGWNRLYRNDGGRQFTDVTQEAGVRDARWGWGTSFFDFDNDGDLDLITTNGYNGEGWADDRTVLWQNNGGVYTDISEAAGITDRLQGRGLVHLDFDRDGDLDIVIVNHMDRPILYRNDGGNANDALRVELEGVQSNRDGIGAMITVVPDLSMPDRRLVWEVDGGSGFLGQNEHTAHFGLGQAGGTAGLITVEWPSGVVQRRLFVSGSQVIRLREESWHPVRQQRP